jgi:phosphohistidine phosphatase SixA
MKKTIYLVWFSVILFFVSCKNGMEYKKGMMIDYIKKEVVFTTDGSQINLGGDSITKIFYLIRHAEKDTQKIDPSLSEVGAKRAVRLTKIMRQSYLDGIYTTMTSRTMQTVDSITQYKGLANNIYTNNNLRETFSEVQSSKDMNRVLVVGHSNTITPLANFLCGKQFFNKIIDEKEYDRFIIIVQKIDHTKQVFEFKY